MSLSKVWAMESQNPIWRVCFLEPFFIPLTVSVKSDRRQVAYSRDLTEENLMKETF